MQYRYIGCFIDKETLEAACASLARTPLWRNIENPHVTFAFMPETVDVSLFGQKVFLTVVGYGNDGKNEGLAVQVRCENDRLQTMAEAIAVPHITLSVAEGAHTVDTAKLSFAPVAPFALEGVFGGYIENVGADIEKRA